MRKKKFGFFCLHFDPPIGGAERSMRNYFKKLSSFMDIEVFCFLDEDGKKFNSTKRFIDNGIFINQCAESIEKVFLRYANSSSPDFVGTQLLWSDPVVFLSYKLGIPCYYFCHGLFEDICQHYLKNTCNFISLTNCDFGDHCPNATNWDRMRRKYSACTKIFCNSEFTKKTFLRFFPENRGKTEIIYPYVDTQVFKYKSKRARSDRKKILAINTSFTKGRNLVHNLAHEMPNNEFIFVDSKDQDSEELKKVSNITLLKKLKPRQLHDYYTSCDALLVPTFMDETFSLVACESILCGTPVVSINKGNLPNMITPGETGFIINNYDQFNWREKVEDALELIVEERTSKIYSEKYSPDNGLEILKKEFDLVSENPKNTLIKKEKIEIESISNKDNKTILFLAKFFNPPLGGGEYFLLKVLKDLQKKGYNLVSACYADPKTEQYFNKEDSLDWEGIPVFRLAREKSFITNFIKKINPDLLITQSFDAPHIIDVCKKMGIKTILGTHFWRNICSVQDNFAHMLDRSLDSVDVLTQNHRAFFNADEVFVNSEFMKLALKKYTGFDCKNIVHPIVDLERVVAEGKNGEYVTLVNPDEGKGGFLFIELAERLPNVKFLCVGRGNEFNKNNRVINEAIDKLSNVDVVENTDKMSDIYSCTKLLLVPSEVDETFSMVTLEAMFNKIPILASNYGNLPYLVEGGGMVVEIDGITWKSSIESIMEDHTFYNSLSEEAFKTAQKYLPEKELSKFEILVKKCIGEPSR